MPTTLSTDNLTSGPAHLFFASDRVSHSQGGITSTVTARNRIRKVDQYGESAIDVIHLGDEVRIQAPLAEWSARTLEVVYAPGDNQLAATGARFMGIGRSAGFRYPKAEARIVPIAAVDALKRCIFYAAVPTGQLDIQHNNEDRDRILNAEFICCIDQSRTDGQLIGRLQVGDSTVTTTTQASTTTLP